MLMFSWFLFFQTIMQPTGLDKRTFTEVPILLKRGILNYIKPSYNLTGITREKLTGVVEWKKKQLLLNPTKAQQYMSMDSECVYNHSFTHSSIHLIDHSINKRLLNSCFIPDWGLGDIAEQRKQAKFQIKYILLLGNQPM